MKSMTMAAAAAFFAVAAKADDTINNVVPTEFDQLVSGSIETCAFGPAVTNVKTGDYSLRYHALTSAAFIASERSTAPV